MHCKILLERREELGLGVKHAAPDSMGGQVAKEALHPVEPGRTGGGEMKMETRVAPLPGLDLRVFARGVVVAEDMDLPGSRSGRPDQIEKADPLLMPVFLHAGADDFARGNVQRGQE